ncbi:hypothetical protein [Bradyrhizobium sp.]|uniref:hypothetical protein n=1 Tax=Bradyrhizobium sp. TaxID=376 RepID=UPI002736CA43|nr:hypothetical protein [Bradyrhizobium sp.]MDP3689466.1 hypothetical protein [Bradyrhizobium sp.]
MDDWEPFAWLGPGAKLPFSEIWSTLLTKTEVGQPAGRFRPGYYFLKALEMAIWGTNVHLWYFFRTLEFTVFIASIWWITSRFVGIWPAAILLIPILAMPFWADVWARLGPSEAYGSGALGILLLGTYGVFAGQSTRVRCIGAIAITFATVILVGVKETLVPFAGLSVALLAIASARRLLSLPLAGSLVVVICGVTGAIMLVVQKTVSGGVDYYARPIELSSLTTIARSSLLHAISYWGPVYLAAGSALAMLERSRGQTLRRWALASLMTAAVFVFLVAMYVSQCVAYRGELPLNMRYDFPGGLFVPINYCLLSCYVAYMTRPYFAPWSNWVVIGAVILSGYLMIPKAAGQFRPLSLPKATFRNIERTDTFFRELQSIVTAAASSPGRPVILETYEPWSWAYEPVFALSTYLQALGAKNPVSIRMHAGDRASGALDEGLKQSIKKLQDDGSPKFVPLATSMAEMKDGCISVGINGPPVPECTGFAVKTE